MNDTITGTFEGNRRGFGFVTGGEGADLFIPAHLTHGAMHKDRVECRVSHIREDGRRVGEITRVLERGYASVVGVYFRERGHGIVVPDESRLGGGIFIARGRSKGAGDGHKVVVSVKPTGGSPASGVQAESLLPEGEVIEILGHVNDPGVDVLSILRQMELPIEFGADEMAAAAEGPLPARTPQTVSAAECVGREDFREWEIVTIDGEDTKDIDDAVSIQRLASGNFELGVHIADVTHYVREGSPLDREAYRRGTSIYLADRVVPMLPHALSNGICSLNPDEDRLTLSCVMEIDGTGMVTAHRIVESVIRSRARLTYTAVKELIENPEPGEAAGANSAAGFAHMLTDMAALAAILREKRQKRGAIGFDFPEAKISVDATGWPTGITPYRRSVATGLIEEFMLAANETVAEEYFWLQTPFVYRSHEEPDAEKLLRLREFAGYFGYTMKGKGAHPSAIQSLLARAENTPEEHIINRMVLQSFKQARYTSENLGHFGLAARHYCHFTSPIRRYPDLQIHRIIKEHLQGRLDAERGEALTERMTEICANCSRTERTAETAEREVTALKKAQYMSDKLGQEFDGVISGVTGRGIYVALPDTVEGMVAARDLPGDRFLFDQERMCYRGEHTKRVYRLGDRVRVQLARVSIQEREIDFVIL